MDGHGQRSQIARVEQAAERLQQTCNRLELAPRVTQIDAGRLDQELYALLTQQLDECTRVLPSQTRAHVKVLQLNLTAW